MSINDKLKKHYEQALPIPDKVLVKKENGTYAIKSWADVIGIDTPLTLIGKWNASTNTPDITGATTGEFWIVTTAGEFELDGITGWKVNDWAVKTKLGWAKVDNQDSVKEVNGMDGYVTLEAIHIPYDPEESELEAENVQEAIDEIVETTKQSFLAFDIELNKKVEQDDIDTSITTHNTDEEAHTDIRGLIGSKLEQEDIDGLLKDVSYTSATGELTFTREDDSEIVINLPLDLLVESGSYDSETQEIVLVLANEDEIRILVDDLVDEYYADDITIEKYVDTEDDDKRKFRLTTEYKEKVDDSVDQDAVDASITAHNTDEEAHEDIRLELGGKFIPAFEVPITTVDWDGDNEFTFNKVNGLDSYFISYAIGFAEKFADMNIIVVAETATTITVKCDSPDDITLIVKGVA